MSTEKSTRERDTWIAFGAGLGVTLGAVVGSLFNDVGIPMGVSTGIIIGTLVALLFGEKIFQFFSSQPDNE
ncbi:MAG: hypothetical protein K9N38_06870 [Candidatus Marinimicrobia bacterium]|nr:hypothetical protein [Candidatus Neomarinimicrobiota bacterium]